MTPRAFALGLLLTLAAGAAVAQKDDENARLELIFVSASRLPQSDADVLASTGVLTAEALSRAGARHPSEIMGDVAGAWVSRGNGQEHLTALRSPVLTGAGACGAFLVLEDGIPTRPAGFCNVNQLFEINTEQASRVEIMKGPAAAAFGSNGLHGVINVIPQRDVDAASASIEAWNRDYQRAGLTLPIRFDGSSATITMLTAREGNVRDNAGYEISKLNATWSAKTRPERQLRLSFSGAYLNQDTAGFLFGEDAYGDEALFRTNANPEAYRNAHAVRLGGYFRQELEQGYVELKPYARVSRMDFLQHFLPGQPTEDNGHESVGVMTNRVFLADDLRTSVGMDFEFSSVYLKEFQSDPVRIPSAFLRETRPVGAHYDYDADTAMIAFHVAQQQSLGPFELEWGLRLEHLRYRYDNNLAPGNLRPDGTACGFGGCLFTRPADRRDDFTNVAPKLALGRRFDNGWLAYGSIARGFRAPQTTELYRLQSGQRVSDLDSETLDTLEFGLKRNGSGWGLKLAAFLAEKRNFIFRDANGFNVSAGKTRHAGLEVSGELSLTSELDVTFAGTHARHTYRFTGGVGEPIVSGNEVDTAPRHLASAQLLYRPNSDIELALRLTHQGSYYLDAANSARYPGHDILDLRLVWQATRGLSATLFVDNLADRRFADRADFAFGQFRYFPDPGRRAGIRLSASFGGRTPASAE